MTEQQNSQYDGLIYDIFKCQDHDFLSCLLPFW